MDLPIHRILTRFPGLTSSAWSVTSPADSLYNCIAWAAGDTETWWWPTDGHYWPAEVPREQTLDAFVAAFQALDYEHEPKDAPAASWERVAIYCRSGGKPIHAARQLPEGNWTSKLGTFQDVRHELRDLEGREYGHVAVILARERKETRSNPVVPAKRAGKPESKG